MSVTRRANAARSRTSAGYLVCLLMAPSSQELEPPGKPEQFKVTPSLRFAQIAPVAAAGYTNICLVLQFRVI